MSPALLELDEAEEQLSPMYIAPQPRATSLWPVCTENQWLSRAIGWEKIAKTSTDGFPDHKATIRVNSNTTTSFIDANGLTRVSYIKNMLIKFHAQSKSIASTL